MLAQVQRAQLLRPTPFWSQRPAGAKIETFPRICSTSANGTLASGTLFLAMLMEPLKAGESYSSVSFFSGTTALSAGTHQWFTIVRLSDLRTLRSTVNDTSTAWGASTVKTLALSSAYVPDVDTQALIGVMVAATTPPTIRMLTVSTTLPIAAQRIGGASSTSQTTPPADNTLVTTPGSSANLLEGWVS